MKECQEKGRHTVKLSAYKFSLYTTYLRTIQIIMKFAKSSQTIERLLKKLYVSLTLLTYIIIIVLVNLFNKLLFFFFKETHAQMTI